MSPTTMPGVGGIFSAVCVWTIRQPHMHHMLIIILRLVQKGERTSRRTFFECSAALQ